MSDSSIYILAERFDDRGVRNQKYMGWQYGEIKYKDIVEFDLHSLALKYWNDEDEEKLIEAFLSEEEVIDPETDSLTRMSPRHVDLGGWLNSLSPQQVKDLDLLADRQEELRRNALYDETEEE